MRLVAITSASKPSIAINATQRAIRARITPRMARPPSLAAPQRTNDSIPSIFGGEIRPGMRRVPAEFVTRSGASPLTSPSWRPAADYGEQTDVGRGLIGYD